MIIKLTRLPENGWSKLTDEEFLRYNTLEQCVYLEHVEYGVFHPFTVRYRSVSYCDSGSLHCRGWILHCGLLVSSSHIQLYIWFEESVLQEPEPQKWKWAGYISRSLYTILPHQCFFTQMVYRPTTTSVRKSPITLVIDPIVHTRYRYCDYYRISLNRYA